MSHLKINKHKVQDMVIEENATDSKSSEDNNQNTMEVAEEVLFNS